jgi:hypothetical protein
MGIDKRKDSRYRKRLTLKFGVDDTTKVGFTEDISNTGIFIRSTSPVAPNTILTVEIKTLKNDIIRLKGRVMWANAEYDASHQGWYGPSYNRIFRK